MKTKYETVELKKEGDEYWNCYTIKGRDCIGAIWFDCFEDWVFDMDTSSMTQMTYSELAEYILQLSDIIAFMEQLEKESKCKA